MDGEWIHRTGEYQRAIEAVRKHLGLHPDCSTNTPPPAALTPQQRGMRAKRAGIYRQMTPEVRAGYRRGYLAGAKQASRWRAALTQVLLSLQRAARQEIL